MVKFFELKNRPRIFGMILFVLSVHETPCNEDFVDHVRRFGISSRNVEPLLLSLQQDFRLENSRNFLNVVVGNSITTSNQKCQFEPSPTLKIFTKKKFYRISKTLEMVHYAIAHTGAFNGHCILMTTTIKLYFHEWQMTG